MEKTTNPAHLDDALYAVDRIINQKGARSFLFFFDFDGTLAPIGPEPDQVVLNKSIRRQLENLAENYPVAVVSGRERTDIESRIGLNNVYYAGSHGFDISGPGGTTYLHPEADDLMPKIDEIGERFRALLASFEGVLVEKKKFAIAIHYRKADPDTVEKVQNSIWQKMLDEKGLKWEKGKSIIEIKPDVDWHKGKAVLWIMDHLELDFEKCLPLYMGDDTTDEDAFRALKGRGVGILVDGSSNGTSADYLLESQEEVTAFIKKLLEHV